MKWLRKLFKPAWKHEEFDPKMVLKQNKKVQIPVEEYNSALTEIELRDR